MDILKSIARNAAAEGNRVAFTSRAGSLTYAQLWEKSGRLAGRIDAQMGDNRDPVIVYGHKDPMMLICFLACVRSGRAYCPMDTNMPEDRLTSVAREIGDPLILIAHPEGCGLLGAKTSVAASSQSERSAQANNNAQTELSEQTDNITQTEFPETEHKVISYDELLRITETSGEPGQSTPETALRACSGEDVFYIIFTSGSTGKPKGVQITADNLNGYLEWAVDLAGGIQRSRVFLNQAPYSFDLSVMDLYLSLATCGKIVSIDRELQSDIPKMTDFLSLQHIEYWVSTPSFAELCMGEPSFSADRIPSIRAFLFCGEVLTNETARRLMERFPDAKVVNTYGPTETTVCVTQVRITGAMVASDSPLPVGRPGPMTRIETDPETNEIIITGNTVSPGYYKDPGRTAKVFSECETNVGGSCGLTGASADGSDSSCGSCRSYRTGDKGYLDETGMLYCEGRLDHQIKLHGYRMELEDIEANLEKLPGVSRAVVAPSRSGSRIDFLTAFIIRDGDGITDDYAGRKTVRSGLRELVPAYMVPKKIRFVEKFPMTGNGKLDRKQLEAMS